MFNLAKNRSLFLIFLVFSVGCTRRANTTSVEQDSKRSEINIEDSVFRPPETVSLITPNSLGNRALIGPLADAYRRIDPQSDGWDTEVFGAAASKQLKHLADAIETNAESSEIVSQEFRSPSLTGESAIREVFNDKVLRVSRIQKPLRSTSSNTGPKRVGELVEELRSLIPQHLHIKFKLYRVDRKDSMVETHAYFHAAGGAKNELREITAKWRITWATPKQLAAQPLIAEIQIEELESIRKVGDQQTLFADCTSSILDGDKAYEQQFRFGTDHWRARICRDAGLDVVANHGIAIGDVNGDFLEDIYICQQGGLPNRLYLQKPDGTLKDVSADSGVDWLDYSASALLIDLDNDGDRDLVLAHEQRIVLMSNDGKGKFQVEHILPARAQLFSMSACDFDSDGDLDIYCCGYNNLASMVRTGRMGEPIPYHDAQNGGPNMLLRNGGNWVFSDCASDVGLDQNNNRFSFAASWEDYDNDGDLDLYVANDYGRNNLYRNNNGTFVDVAAELNVQDMSAGMSVSWADMNRDGWMDFYVSNMFSAAGNRITYQRQFKDSTDDDTRKQFQRHARGNSLFQSDGKGRFRDISEPAGITMGRWAWGSKFCDINNDGWHDILVNNGFISTSDTGDL